jgi:hypothetical protein
MRGHRRHQLLWRLASLFFVSPRPRCALIIVVWALQWLSLRPRAPPWGMWPPPRPFGRCLLPLLTAVGCCSWRHPQIAMRQWMRLQVVVRTSPSSSPSSLLSVALCLGSAQPPPHNWRHHRAVDANDAHPKLMDTEMRPRWLPRFPSDLLAAAADSGCVRHRCLQGLFPP